MEKIEFDLFIAQFQLFDFFSQQNPINYSLDNLRCDNERVLAILGKACSFASDQGPSNQHKEYEILGNNYHSDYKLVIFMLKSRIELVSRIRYKMNNSYMKDSIVVD
jgi:hypothetical protein